MQKKQEDQKTDPECGNPSEYRSARLLRQLLWPSGTSSWEAHNNTGTSDPHVPVRRGQRGGSTGEKQSDQGSVVNTDESSGPKAGTESQLVQVSGQVVRSTEHTHTWGWAATKGRSISKEKPKPRHTWHIHWIQCVYPSGFLVFVCYEGLISQGPCC